MDRLNFGTLIGFYAVECGNVLGLGGAFYAALCAISILSKEEKDRTVEFLFTHPVSRKKIVTEKLVAIWIQITVMNVIIFVLSVTSIGMIGGEIPWIEISLLHLAYYLLQIELAGICFGISAFLRKGSAGIGLGIATMMYFLTGWNLSFVFKSIVLCVFFLFLFILCYKIYQNEEEAIWVYEKLQLG